MHAREDGMSQTYAPVIDADGHIYEDDRAIWRYLPKPYSESDLLFATPFFPTLDGFHRQSHRVRDGRAPQLEIPDANDWITYLDEANIAATVLFPTAGLAFGMIAEPGWATALAQGYNDWLADNYLRLDARRMKGMALIPLQDGEAAAQELRRAVNDLGMVGGILPAAGLYEALGHRSYWPVYEAAAELGCVLGIHGAPSGGLGLDRLHRLIEVRTLTHGFSQMVQMTSMMFEGVFDTFPTVRFAFCEAGCGWVSYLAERLDLEYRNRPSQAPLVKKLPSEHLKGGQIYFHTELGERGLGRAIEDFGSEVFFAASDFPHEPKGDFPEGIEDLMDREDIPEHSKREILWSNPIRLYGLDEQELAPQAASTEVLAGR
jgi:uncharacterized protein